MVLSFEIGWPREQLDKTHFLAILPVPFSSPLSLRPIRSLLQDRCKKEAGRLQIAC